MDFYSPLRYPGGKGKVADYFKQIFKENFLYDGVYVEPYAGGASVALSLLLNEYASKVIINDIDLSIYSFWHSVLFETENICRLINDYPVTVDGWDKQKAIQKAKKQHSKLEIGFSTFFLNRTNRSGIITAGIIGGRQQVGNWKIDARFNKTDLIKRIERIASFKDRIEIHNSDAVKLVKSIANKLPSKTLFYFDPPYFIKGKDLYLNFYREKDHELIAKTIGQLKKPKWIVTYDSVSQIEGLYKRYRQQKYSLSYSAGKANKGEECMIFSDNLYISRNKILNN